MAYFVVFGPEKRVIVRNLLPELIGETLPATSTFAPYRHYKTYAGMVFINRFRKIFS